MNKIRIGKDIKVRWSVKLNDRPITAEDNLTLVMINPRLHEKVVDYFIEDGAIVFFFRGTEQIYTGDYSLILWFNYGELNQSALDAEFIFRLVRATTDESLDDDTIEELIDITGKTTISGASAYEIWLSLGNTGTQEDFINSTGGGGSGSGFEYDETGQTFDGAKEIIIKDGEVKLYPVTSSNSVYTDESTINSIMSDMKTKLDILYKVDVSLSGGKNVKKGTTTTVTLTWTVKVNGTNVNPVNQTLNGEVLNNATRTKQYEGVNTNTDYTLVVDGVTKTASVKFYNPAYFGVVSENYIVSNDVSYLTELSNYGNRAYNKTVTSTGSNKVVYYYPSSLGALTSILDGNGFSMFNSFTKYSKFTDTNNIEQDIIINGEKYFAYLLNDAADTNNKTFKFN